uniref:LRRC37A/B like protein 1 C-terminal domain-containing protein n=1 Tax=Pipistrellus kuhlii TaxID=59472 RepID=A0A7J7U8B2_PIPKU|nr:hypothetical protein mPipKuh1_009196 [Pipistrellus kuhlii]
MKVLRDRKNYNSSELIIEPERTSSQKNSNTLTAFMSLLMKLLDEQQEVKVSKGEWDTEPWKSEKMETLEEAEEEEAPELTKEVPKFRKYNTILIASPVIAVVAFFFVVFCFIAMCGRKASTSGSSRGSFRSSQLTKSAEYQLEEGGFCARLFQWLKDLATCQRKSEKSQDASENEAFLKMEQGEEEEAAEEEEGSEAAAEEAAAEENEG